MKKTLNFFPGKNLRGARWRREREEVVRTWSRDRLLRRGVAVKDFKGPDKHNAFLGFPFS